ncbi:hypothetical protein ACN27J_26630 [Solwaraspora sp. WMMB762]|uniref:hypothetical protein n=1 Tax=Solwaraspora sp. WMMB762 TaxID=3404120 RepID=UPI003B92F347
MINGDGLNMLHHERLDKLLPTAAMVGVLAMLAACSPEPSTSDEAAEPPAGSGGQPAGSDPVSGQHPLLAATLAMDPQVRAVVGRLTEACLRDAGIDRFPAQLPAGLPGPAVVPPQQSPMLDEATANGYGIRAAETANQADAEADAGATTERFTWPSPAEERRYLEALTGAADGETLTDDAGNSTLGGCVGEARSAVYGEVAAPPSPVTAIDEAARAGYAADPTVASATAAWSDCLQQAGQPQLLDPADARRFAQYFHHPVGERPGGRVPEDGPWPAEVAQEKEIALAVADAGCADRTGLREAQRLAWEKALDAAVDRHGAELSGYRDAMAAALRQGQQVLAD